MSPPVNQDILTPVAPRYVTQIGPSVLILLFHSALVRMCMCTQTQVCSNYSDTVKPTSTGVLMESQIV